MPIVFDPLYYFVGIWFVGHDDALPMEDRVDWLAAIWREAPDGPWKIEYRFRYHTAGPRPEADDDKHWYAMQGGRDLSDAEVAGPMHLIAKLTAARNRSEVCYVPVHGSGDRAMELLRQQPWVHFEVRDGAAADSSDGGVPLSRAARRRRQRGRE